MRLKLFLCSSYCSSNFVEKEKKCNKRCIIAHYKFLGKRRLNFTCFENLKEERKKERKRNDNIISLAILSKFNSSG